MLQDYYLDTCYTFKTKQFTVIARIYDCPVPDLSWDETGEVRKQINSGEYICFTTKVSVELNGHEIASTWLGESIYETPKDFFTEHVGAQRKYGSYFRDMVSEVCGEARKALANTKLHVPTTKPAMVTSV